MEAALFKRHWKAAQHKLEQSRPKEDKRRQDAFLKKAYRESLAEDTGEDADDIDWDPIEDILEDNRSSFVDLVQHFPWICPNGQHPERIDPLPAIPSAVNENAAASPQETATTPASRKSKSKSKSKSKKKAANPSSQSSTPQKQAVNPSKNSTPQKQAAPTPLPDKGLIETRQEMHNRLRRSTPTTLTSIEIKYFLFCRLLLGHATLLPAALRSNSVEEFLADPDVPISAMRDLCLKMERPGPQEIRDACANLFRSEEEADEDENSKTRPKEDDDSDADDVEMRLLKYNKTKGELPEKWVPKREKAEEDVGNIMSPEGVGPVGFGPGGDGKQKSTKIRVKVCGCYIWSYPSDKAMNRAGWLHFCIIAKDSRLQDAVSLCGHWDEFFKQNILGAWHYFPGANWAEWVGNRPRQQMLQMGFIVYVESDKPDSYDLTSHHQTGSRNHAYRRAHSSVEARNFMCAHIKRDDQISRRLIQYLSMQSREVLVLVRDAESGKLFITPDEDQRWIYREKGGLGRAVKNDWNVIRSIRPKFFEDIDQARQWHFSFPEYYDVCIWDLEPGHTYPHLYNIVQGLFFKAHRGRSGLDLYRPAEPVLRTLYKDKKTHRPRQIKPEDRGKVESIWDELQHIGTRFFFNGIDET
ncbi:hypothetical protein LSUE1_G006522 [Lachnellula suecica]|uniref:Uncharacterized protein n=1 Tax=Lachnellula suecica TaxID=602035 RepID=A0A8T9BVU2_9HELO|nr:hypothetical protein LSUE1_G006522 [Lachnellula suecica]